MQVFVTVGTLPTPTSRSPVTIEEWEPFSAEDAHWLGSVGSRTLRRMREPTELAINWPSLGIYLVRGIPAHASFLKMSVLLAVQ